MEHKPLFGDLIAAHEGLAEELKAVDVAADLTLLLHHAGKTRADLARALGWSRARVTQVLSGHENLTVETIAAVTKALGYTFDAVFRKVGAPAASQPWESQATLALDMVDAPDLQEWMSRKTMKPMSGLFAGAMEFVNFGVQLVSSNHDEMFKEEACAA
ncbi:helix-turn-helix transcriptional regulator [Curvibacter sp. CHRR-16]|uniref:helix-turn-helix domain-containing protein n=1 Tax=Curvibacter sp. CHRR-16 TaxID=2835872 RepID=UPI001BD9994A|nr:helix-turn-helix transcriptional regulator [Curvibacter sp. CHRR-16]MBT0569815.1 helix-turn-helix transcriptional regulator [Curvibacter sp. CHRR-16]